MIDSRAPRERRRLHIRRSVDVILYLYRAHVHTRAINLTAISRPARARVYGANPCAHAITAAKYNIVPCAHVYDNTQGSRVNAFVHQSCPSRVFRRTQTYGDSFRVDGSQLAVPVWNLNLHTTTYWGHVLHFFYLKRAFWHVVLMYLQL